MTIGPPPELLQSIDDADADWFTAALQQQLPGIRVEQAQCTRLIHGTSTKARFHLRYGGDAAARAAASGAPGSLWLKAGFEPHSAQMGEIGIYEYEARFYSTLRPQLSVVAPRSWYSRFDAARRQGVILLEDLDARGARILTPTAAMSLPQARSGLQSLARLHARWWGSAALDAMDWLELTIRRGTASAGWIALHDAAIIERYRSQRREALGDLPLDAQRLMDASWALVDHYIPDEPRCLLHGDAHLGNCYVDADGATGFLDWQVVRKGRWAFDVAYFLGSALEPAERRAHERTLLHDYLLQLASLGVAAPELDDAWLEYRRNMIYGLLVWFLNPPDGRLQAEANNLACIRRFATAVEDLDTYRSLGV
jgi:hypothetical protein